MLLQRLSANVRLPMGTVISPFCVNRQNYFGTVNVVGEALVGYGELAALQ